MHYMILHVYIYIHYIIKKIHLISFIHVSVNIYVYYMYCCIESLFLEGEVFRIQRGGSFGKLMIVMASRR